MNLSIMKYSMITSTKPPSFCIKPSMRISHLLLQSCDCSYYTSRQILAPPLLYCRNTLINEHTTSYLLQTCDISLDWLTLPAPEDFVESICYNSSPRKVISLNYTILHNMVKKFSTFNGTQMFITFIRVYQYCWATRI